MILVLSNSRIINLDMAGQIYKRIYFANDYDAKYGYDKNHEKPIIAIADINDNPIEVLYFSKECDRDAFFDDIIRFFNKPVKIEYDYCDYNKDN